MNLLYVVSVWPGDGEPNMHSDFVDQAVRDGHNVTVLALCEKRNNVQTNFKRENGTNYLTIRCGNIQKTNKYQKVISSVMANFHIVHGVNKHLANEKFDVVVWTVSSTLLWLSVHWLVKKFYAKEYMLLKEYWPQDPVDLGALREGGLVFNALKYVEHTMLKQADYIGTSSPGGIKYVLERYPDCAPKCEVCPHCELPRDVNKGTRDEVLTQYGIPADKVIFLYGGNLGLSQGIEDIIACVKRASENKDAYFAFFGSGTEYGRVQAALGNIDNVMFRSGLKYSRFLELASVCDCGLIFLNKVYNVPNIPGKLNTYLNAELPIVACVDKTTDAGNIIADGGAGIKVHSGNVDEFCEAISRMMVSDLRRTMSQNAKKLLCEGYTPKVVLDTIEAHFELQSKHDVRDK